MRSVTTFMLAVATAVVALAPTAAPAEAAKSAKPQPKITRVTPMRLAVGETLVIRGARFKSKPRSNTVVFQGPSGRTAFAKPKRASASKLVVKVPASVARLLVVSQGKQRPTRIKLRVLAGRFSAFTPRRLSPVVVGLAAGGEGGSGGGGGGTPNVCKSDSDHDNDLLPNDVELQYETDPCIKDTDRDGSSDGWEFYSAKDLNIKAVPYPGKRPYPNPLDPSDRPIDFDGDGLLAHEEYRAWVVTGSSFEPSKVGGLDLESPLGYSEGTQYSRASEAPSVPAWRAPSYGLPAPPYPFPATYELHGDVGTWRDDERDADRDGLSNWLESLRGPGQVGWWAGFWAQEEFGIEPWPKVPAGCPVGAPQAPGAFGERPFASLDLADPDIDGDTLLDGEDDQDSDDYMNAVELYQVTGNPDGDAQAACGYAAIPTVDVGGASRIVNAFNPCAPSKQSRTCPPFEPF